MNKVEDGLARCAALVLGLLVAGGCAGDAPTPSDAGMGDGGLVSDAAPGMADAGVPSWLERELRHRLVGDRSGACVQGAFWDGREERLEQTVVCAGEGRSYDAQTTFEIGSISKVMTAFLLRTLVARGELGMQDALADALGSPVPGPDGRPIRLQDVATHTSGLPGLPPGFDPADPSDPYADLTAEALIGALEGTELQTAPGTASAYSNFGYMLLSHVVSTRLGGSFETALQRELLEPLGLRHSFVSTVPEGVVLAPGHIPGGAEVSNWAFAPTLAGVGGVRSTATDVLRFARLALGDGPSELVATMEATTAELPTPEGGDRMGTGWFHLMLGDQALLFHNGGTGGASSVMFVHPEMDRAVVLLSDTAFAAPNTVELLGARIIAPEVVGATESRRETAAPEELLQALAGRYELSTLGVELSHRDGVLSAAVAGQGTLEFGFDTAGDFFPRGLNALLRPVRGSDGVFTFDWIQGGGVIRARRTP